MEEKETFIKVEKETRSRTVKVLKMSEIQVFRRHDKPDFTKVMVDVETADGQKIYAEVRNSNISMLNPIRVGDIVEIDYIFAGSEKAGKKYNNIFIVNIEKI